MPEQLQKFVQPVQTRWNNLTKDQKIRLIAAVLIVILALVATVYFTTRTKYVVFLRNLDGTELTAIETALDEKGIKYRRASNATAIEVAEESLGDAQVEVNNNPNTNTMPFTYADALTNSGMSTTESMRRSMLIRAKQNDLNNDLKRFNGVVDASVQLYIPESNRLLMGNQEQSRASVILETSRQLTRNEGVAIARHICRAVEGLAMENIEITDSNYGDLYSGMADSLGSGVGSIAEMRDQEQNQVKKQIRNLFMPTWSEVQIATNFVYSSVITENEVLSTVAPPIAGSETGVPITTFDRTTSAQGGATADEPGLGANDAASPSYSTGSDDSYKAKENESSTDYEYDRSVIERSSGPGSYSRSESSLAVSLFKFEPFYQESYVRRDRRFSQDDWEELQRNNPERDITDEYSLDRYKDMIAAATGIDSSKISVTVWNIPIFYEYIRPPVEIQQIIMFAVLALLILMLAYGLIRRTKPEEEEEEMEPELSVEDLLVSTQLEEAKAEEEELEGIDYFKESEVKKQIEKFVSDRPESVAQLLRNWLNSEDW